MSYKDLSSFYKSSEWEKFRELVLLERMSDDGVLRCEYSGEPIVNKYDAVVHHKIELTEKNVFDHNISLNPDNVMVVSFKSHNLIHQRFEGFIQRVYLVYGSPCAGKSTWVNNVANPDDLIVDIDRIWECICNSDKYHKPNKLKRNMFGVRDALLDQIRTRTGMWRNAWVIGGFPLRTERDSICDRLRAEPVFIDTAKEVCLERAIDDKWKIFIEDWFDSYVE